MAEKIVVTSALLYANGPLHIGHLVEYIQTDIYVRFLKLQRKEVLYVCADDTHGAPIQINADKLGMKPEQMIQKFYKEHKRDFKAFGVHFDNYYTTHSDENRHFADIMFLRARERGHIFKKKISQLYCPKDQMFLPDRYVKGTCPKCGAQEQYGDVCEKCGATYKPTELSNAHCAICRTKPVKKHSEHYFFRLSSFKNELTEWLKNESLQPEMVNSVRQWIKEGLQDWDISRDGPYFGFKIPGEDNLYYYVWWDAPIGYIASLQNLLGKDSAEKYWKDAKVMHFIGKDIIYFHFLFWPAVLHATGFKKPDTINVHGFLTVNGQKMSKSRGTFLTAEEFAEKHNPEHLRYYIASSLSRKLQDIDLDFDDFTSRVNNELVANIGNFCYRALSFTNKNFEGKIGEPDYNGIVMRQAEETAAKVLSDYEGLNFKEAVKGILALSDIGNRYFQDMQPWKLIKEDKEKCRQVMGLCVNLAKNIAILISPIMPKMSAELCRQLKIKPSIDKLGFDIKNHSIAEPKILVQKIEAQHKDFPLDLRAGKIIDIAAHPDAEKLLVIKVDLGTEQRQLVAGLAPYYSPQELLNKKIIVLANLKPAKLRGIESQGMLLAAQSKQDVRVLEPDAEPGQAVAPKGSAGMKQQISIDRFMKLNKLRIIKGKVCFGDEPLIAGTNAVTSEMPDDSVIR